jgi:hypothetical protein
VLIARFGALGAGIVLPATLALHTLLLGFAIRRDGTRLEIARQTWQFAAAALVMGVAIAFAGLTLDLYALIPLGVVIYVVLCAAFARLGAPRGERSLRAMLLRSDAPDASTNSTTIERERHVDLVAQLRTEVNDVAQNV